MILWKGMWGNCVLGHCCQVLQNIFVCTNLKKIMIIYCRPCNFSQYSTQYTEPPLLLKILYTQIRNLTTPIPSILSSILFPVLRALAPPWWTVLHPEKTNRLWSSRYYCSMVSTNLASLQRADIQLWTLGQNWSSM